MSVDSEDPEAQKLNELLAKVGTQTLDISKSIHIANDIDTKGLSYEVRLVEYIVGMALRVWYYRESGKIHILDMLIFDEWGRTLRRRIRGVITISS